MVFDGLSIRIHVSSTDMFVEMVVDRMIRFIAATIYALVFGFTPGHFVHVEDHLCVYLLNCGTTNFEIDESFSLAVSCCFICT